MTRSRVDDRAQLIYDFLKANLNTVYKIGDLLGALDLNDGTTTRTAIRRARGLAVEDGLCFPVACPANGFTYCVTDNPSAALDPAIHLGGIGLGVGVRKDVHDEFIRSRMAELTPSERSLVLSIDHMDAAQRESRKAQREVLKAIVGFRRGLRDETGEAS